LFRFIAIGIGVYLIKLWWVKVIGAVYLAWLAIKYFIDKRKGKEEAKSEGLNKESILIRLFGTFWGTVVAVELMDIAFSVDSVLAALGISEQVWILLGGMLGVLMMRGIVGLFIKLIDRIPELETTAYIIIAFISIKMVLSVFNIHLEHSTFFIIILVSFLIPFFVHFIRK
jgi:YkoY family integral membrane protein